MLDVTFPETGKRVVVHHGVIEGLKTFRQIYHSDLEACGILLGKLYDGAVEITHYTKPQSSDRRSRYSYFRGRTGHLDAAMQIWEKSNGLIGYIGEWHTHPQARPTPSSIDVTESIKIAEANLNPIVALILGTTYGCIFLADQKFMTRPISFLL